jgi:hypothetical protein
MKEGTTSVIHVIVAARAEGATQAQQPLRLTARPPADLLGFLPVALNSTATGVLS